MFNICMLSSGHPPFDDRVYYKEALSLTSIGRVTIIAPCDNSRVTEDGIEIVGIPRRGKILGRLIPLVFLFIIGLRLKADVYHCHEADSLLIGYLLKTFTGAKLIYDAHEYYPEAFSEKFCKILQKTVFYVVTIYEKFICKRCDAVITVNEDLLRKFLKYNKNSEVIPNYPTQQHFKYKASDDFTKKDLGKYLIYAGGLTIDRGLIEMIELLNILVVKNINIKLLLVGYFNNSRDEKIIQKIISEKNLTSFVHFTGRLEHSQIPELMRNALAGLLFLKPISRYQKAEPIKLFEYMASGIPVVSYDYSGVKNIIKYQRCGIVVPPLNVNEAAESVIYLFNNPSMAADMGIKGVEAFQKYYNWDICEKRLQKVYRILKEKNNACVAG